MLSIQDFHQITGYFFKDDFFTLSYAIIILFVIILILIRKNKWIINLILSSIMILVLLWTVIDYYEHWNHEYIINFIALFTLPYLIWIIVFFTNLIYILIRIKKIITSLISNTLYFLLHWEKKNNINWKYKPSEFKIWNIFNTLTYFQQLLFNFIKNKSKNFLWENDNFITISKNCTTIYVKLKSLNLWLKEKQYWLYTWIINWYSYIYRFWQITKDDIYELCLENDTYEDFLFDFIELLMEVDYPIETFETYSNVEEVNIIKKKINEWIYIAKKNNSNLYDKPIKNILNKENIDEYIFN